MTAAREIISHKWERQPEEWYAEPSWCSKRLFEEECFDGPIWDPCCGLGTILKNADDAGRIWFGSDIVKRSRWCGDVSDFLECGERYGFLPYNIVCNPPFNLADKFALSALSLDAPKVAMIFPTARLHAAHWIKGLPLRRVWLMTPRPSMPPGHIVEAGGKVGGGKVDYCWIVFKRGYVGPTEIKWLRKVAA